MIKEYTIMTEGQSEALAHRFHTTFSSVVAGSEVLPRNPLATDEILAADFVGHVNGQELRGIEAWRQTANAYQIALPDARLTHHETVVAGNRVVIRYSGEATQTGPLGDIPASGKSVSWEGLDLFHLRDGKIIEMWVELDMLGFMQQIGAIPSAEQHVA